MITTYEQNFINERISEHAIAEFISNNECEIIIDINIDLCKPQLTEKQTTELYKRASVCELSKKLNKSILELCFEIKRITVERLNAISIEQWTRWAERYGLRLSEVYDPNTNSYSVFFEETKKFANSLYLFTRINNNIQFEEFNARFLIELLYFKNFNVYTLENINLTTKAIHDLVWELETI